ncbi:rRNA maturation RNase YbeY [Falsiroseomonas selenitidurans]|uniref:Endoribonuclease YbeY n=1 Tax=Falsiroseomonas selenitidurans TaxID=2716335 RepID=A0ABX1DZV8_9PROT|nr:rRNA maturation RNase YbeY [Falsiroseomonas selenitidurans]NKC30440.1 rRNA maturation RNase YbeY [Falsiroseomonas selenitidurans]OYW10406.1 MAG: rRNA maturation RNase YbeY [Rhodospirillales bacterium 12-71-4]
MPDQGMDITIVLATQKWRAAVPRAEALARRAVAAAMRDCGADGAVTVLLTDDAAIKRLNTGHRDKAKPTNVLSFPAGMPGHLGDIALALGVVRREAREAGRRASDHLAHLLAHGTLHLAGHDHLLAGEARRMEQAEARVMRRLGRPNPWKEGRGRPAT